MTTPAKVKLLILQGATFRKRLRWSSPSGVPIDLTACTARMQVREEKSSPTVLLSLGTTGAPDTGLIVLGGVDGTIDLSVSAEITAAIDWTSGVWDLEIIMSNGDVVRLAEGSVSVSAEVTRD
ncbi:hypothetical protein N5F13_19960 [Comamonas thiooxydans]|uniref:hypothetical protein n=1 Tax=Comamonas thiooxydans TaxID=363952 RepID=UPI002447FAC9|nr:hypothetical protein [Comamonas thiooxydans]MDH1476779.1 hypothetical protein [Comamonas thiooxydans]